MEDRHRDAARGEDQGDLRQVRRVIEEGRIDAHPFTSPSVKPVARYFFRKNARVREGIRLIVATAKMSFQYTLCCPRSAASETGMFVVLKPPISVFSA